MCLRLHYSAVTLSRPRWHGASQPAAALRLPNPRLALLPSKWHVYRMCAPPPSPLQIDVVEVNLQSSAQRLSSSVAKTESLKNVLDCLPSQGELLPIKGRTATSVPPLTVTNGDFDSAEVVSCPPLKFSSKFKWTSARGDPRVGSKFLAACLSAKESFTSTLTSEPAIQ